MEVPTRGLVIRQPWLDHIMAGRKRWEIRSRPCRVSGIIALIEAGHGRIRAVAHLTACRGPLQPEDWIEAARDGDIVGPEAQALGYLNAYAWELGQVQSLRHPVPYVHPRGAIIWVRLPQEVQQAVLKNIPV